LIDLINVYLIARTQKEEDMDSFCRKTFDLGEIIVVSDGVTAFPSDFLMIGVNESERLDACRKYGFDPDNVTSQMNCIVLRRDDQTVLFDTGAGSTMPGCGTIQNSLAAAEITPESIDLVIHTHLHLDHVGGNLDANGKPAFPNARYCIGQTEWDFWNNADTLASLDRGELWKLPDFEPAMADAVRKNVIAIRDRVHTFPDDGEPVPGVRAIPAFGHTPGHLAFEIDLGNETLFITADLVLSPFHVEHAQWFPAVDLDPDAAVRSRARVFNKAVEMNALVSGYHLPFPGLGRVTIAEDGWNWIDEVHFK
jgi:glyoxylase-like metal-dependent hydrolase (beta-lactamase superfamily II)